MLVQVFSSSARAMKGHINVQLVAYLNVKGMDFFKSKNKFEKLPKSKFITCLLTELSTEQDYCDFPLFKCTGLFCEMIWL